MKKLEALYLTKTETGDDGVAHLKDLTNLRVLYLDETPITDAALDYLYGMNEMTMLVVFNTRTSDEAKIKLLEALPKLRKIYNIDYPRIWAREGVEQRRLVKEKLREKQQQQPDKPEQPAPQRE